MGVDGRQEVFGVSIEVWSVVVGVLNKRESKESRSGGLGNRSFRRRGGGRRPVVPRDMEKIFGWSFRGLEGRGLQVRHGRSSHRKVGAFSLPPRGIKLEGVGDLRVIGLRFRDSGNPGRGRCLWSRRWRGWVGAWVYPLAGPSVGRRIRS